MHVGQNVEDAVRKSGLSLTVVAKRLGISRRTLYQWFSYPDLSPAKVYRVGVVINHDFSGEVESLDSLVNEDEHHYNAGIAPDYKKILFERDKYLRLYHETIEKYNAAMEKVIELQQEIAEMRKGKG